MISDIKSKPRRTRAKGPKLSRGDQRVTSSVVSQVRRNVDEVHAAMDQNARAYVSTLFHPFEVRGMRVPESTPFPSAVGSWVYRYTPPAVSDAGVTPTKKIAGMFFGLDPCLNGVWTAHVSSYSDAFVETWTTASHPAATAGGIAFNLIRTVSRGIKLVNVSTLVERGGALYVSYAAVRPDSGIIADLKLAAETEVFDAARLSKDGMTAVYLPLTNMAMVPTESKSNPVYIPACSYINPASDHTDFSPIFDCNVYIWVEGTVEQDLSLEFEEVWNWEAIPWPQTESLFSRRAVMASEDAKAAAMQQVLSSGPAVSNTSFWGKVKVAGSKVADFGLQQLETVARTMLSALPGLLLGDDYNNHRLALAIGCPKLSPVNRRESRGLKPIEFLALCNTELLGAPSPPVLVPASVRPVRLTNR